MKLRIVTLLAFSLSLGTLHSQEVWEKKPPASWSEKEAKKVLEDSPWTNKFSISHVVILETSRSADSFDRDSTKELWYRAQLWSARPVREARVRGMQIQSQYDRLKPEDKKAFDERAKGFIEAPFPDTIVVRVTYGSSVTDFDRKMARHWTGQTLDMQKSMIFLVADGKRIPMVNFQQSPSGGNEFYATFPRTIAGEPVLGTTDAKLGIEFQHPTVEGSSGSAYARGTSGLGVATTPVGQVAGSDQLGSKNSQRVWIEFKPSKMTYQGKLAY